MSGSRDLNDDLVVDFSGVFAAAWSAKWRLLFWSLLVAGLTFLAASFMSPRYQSDAQVFIESREVQVTRNRNSAGEVESSRATLTRDGVASVAQLMSSRDLVLSVVRDFNLVERPEFNSALKSGVIQDILALAGLSDPLENLAEERTLEKVMERLSVSQVGDSAIIRVQFRSSDRELAAEFPNALVTAFLANEAQAPEQSVSAVATVLKDEIESLRARVEQADIRIADFRADASLENTGGPNATPLATQQLSDLSTQLGQVRSDRASAAAKAEEIRRIIRAGGAVDTVADVQASPLIQRLVENQANIRAQIAQLSSSLLPGHPRLKSLQSQLADLEGEIASQARKIVTSLENQVTILSQNEEELNGELNRLRGTAREAETASARLNRLESEAASLRELLSTYQGRYNQALSRRDRDGLPVNARFAGRATLAAEPYFPKTVPMTVAAFVVTFMLGLLIVIAKALLTGQAMRKVPHSEDEAAPLSENEQELEDIIESIKEPDVNAEAALSPDMEEMELEEEFPEFDDEEAQPEFNGLLAANAASPADRKDADIEKYDAAELASLLGEDVSRRVVMVSPQGDAGAKACLQLARGLAVAGHSTVLVDMSGTWTGSTAQLGLAEQMGTTDILCGRAGFSEIIQKDERTGLHVVPAGKASLGEAATGMGRMPMVLDALQDNYDFVLIDCGLSSASGAVKVACEDALCVICVDDAPSPMLRRVIKDMQAEGFQSVPVVDVQNQSEAASGSLLDQIAG
jgi:uncharacterized protein involved in exopolysaccharide biosynthesis/Mrp family chromosome partitioning ATPase